MMDLNYADLARYERFSQAASPCREEQDVLSDGGNRHPLTQLYIKNVMISLPFTHLIRPADTGWVLSA